MPSPNLHIGLLSANVMKLVLKSLVDIILVTQINVLMRNSFTMCGLKKKMSVCESISIPSLDSKSIVTMTIDCPVSGIITNTFYLFKPFSLWSFIIASQIDQDTGILQNLP